jgi:hypothetical protein
MQRKRRKLRGCSLGFSSLPAGFLSLWARPDPLKTFNIVLRRFLDSGDALVTRFGAVKGGQTLSRVVKPPVLRGLSCAAWRNSATSKLLLYVLINCFYLFCCLEHVVKFEASRLLNAKNLQCWKLAMCVKCTWWFVVPCRAAAVVGLKALFVPFACQSLHLINIVLDSCTRK